MYQELKKQYDALELNDKNVLLIYKSRLFKFINNIDDILSNRIVYDEYEKYFVEDKSIICSSENSFIRHSIFNSINFESYQLFLESVKIVKDKLTDIKGKIHLPQDTIVYRATTVSSKDEIDQISKGNFISTSLDIDETDKFYRFSGIDVLYQIKLKKGTSCLVIPYSIGIYDINGKSVLKILEDDSQSEIVLFKDELDYVINDYKYFEDEEITVVKIDTEPIMHNIK